MRRRALLASLGTLGAGCVEPSDDAGRSTRTATTERPPTVDALPVDVPRCEPAEPIYPLADAPPADVEYEIRDVAVATSHERPDNRYRLAPTAFDVPSDDEQDRWASDDDVVIRDVDDMPPGPVHDAIRTAIWDGEWTADRLPDGLVHAVATTDYFAGVHNDAGASHVALTLYAADLDAPPALSFDAPVADRYVSPGDPGSLALTLSSERWSPVDVAAGSVPPFGLVRATRADASADAGFVLWRDYEDEGCFHRTDDGWGKCDVGRRVDVMSCDSIVRRYDVLPTTTARYPADTVPPGPGRYRFGDELVYRPGEHRIRARLSFDVAFTLEAL